MSQNDARAWWADVEHLRERIEARTPEQPAQRASLSAEQRSRVSESHSQTREPRSSESPYTAAPRRPRERRTVVIAGRGAPPVSARVLVDAPGHPAVQRSQAPRITGRALADRPDRVAMWALLLGLALMLVATSSAGAATSLGERTLKVPMKGRDVRLLQVRLKDSGLLNASATAHYGTLTRRAVRRYQRSRCLTADGIAGPATIAALSTRAPRCGAHRAGGAAPSGAAPANGLRGRVVTWYGPGMYGRRTACGDKLTSRLVGVAHRTLPCGTKVRFVNGANVVEARVVDRGPYAAGVDFDLTWAAARDLGVLAAGRLAVQASH